jgi:hypothetical protein
VGAKRDFAFPFKKTIKSHIMSNSNLSNQFHDDGVNEEEEDVYIDENTRLLIGHFPPGTHI